MTNPPSLIEFLQKKRLEQITKERNNREMGFDKSALMSQGAITVYDTVLQFLKENTIPAINLIMHGSDVCAHVEFIRDVILGADKLEEKK